MSSRFRGLLAATLVAGVLAALPACGSTQSSSSASVTPAGKPAAVAASTPQASMPSSDGGATAGTISGSQGSQATNTLPNAGPGLYLAAVGTDSDGQTRAFYAEFGDHGGPKTALPTYLAGLKRAGFHVTGQYQDDPSSPIFYHADKGDLSLSVAFNGGDGLSSKEGLMEVQVDHHGTSFVAPTAPSSEGLETKVPDSRKLQLLAAGTWGSDPIALYHFTKSIGSIDDYVAALKKLGFYSITKAKDPHTGADVYTALGDQKNYTLTDTMNWTDGEELLIVTPTQGY